MNESNIYEGIRFIKATLLTFISQVIILIFTLLSSILLARLLGPYGKGVYTISTLLPLTIVIFLNIGVSPATTYYIAKKEFDVGRAIINNLFLGSLLGIVGYFLGIGAIFIFKKTFVNIPKRFLLLSLIIIPPHLIYSFWNSIFLGIQDFKKYNFIQVLRLSFFLSILLVLVGLLKLDLKGALLSFILHWFLVDFVLFFWLRMELKCMVKCLDIGYLKKVVSYGLQAYLGNVLAFLNYRISFFLLNHYLNPEAVGYYSASIPIAEVVWIFSFAASTVLFPKISALEEQKRKQLTPFVVKNVFILTLFFAFFLFLFAKHVIILLYSSTFLPSVKPFRILLIGTIFLSLSRVFANDIAGRGKPVLNSIVSGIALGVNLLLNIILIPKYGIQGAALATTVTYAVILIFRLAIYLKLSGNTIKTIFVLNRKDFSFYKGILLAFLKNKKVKLDI